MQRGEMDANECGENVRGGVQMGVIRMQAEWLE